MEEEIWKSVPNYDGLYEVSNMGRVRSLDRIVPHSSGKIICKRKGKQLKLNIGVRGYRRVTFIKNNKRKTYYVHRLVLIVFNRESTNTEVCLHLNNIPIDNRLDNLKWGTQKENVHQCISEKRTSCIGTIGEESLLAKLRNEDIIKIKQLLNNKIDQKQ